MARALKKFKCAHCGKECWRCAAKIKLNLVHGRRNYCSRSCHWAANRAKFTDEERREKRRRRDRKYYAANIDKLRPVQKASHKRNYAKNKIKILARAKQYKQRPEVKARMREYDRQYGARRFYGPLAEVYLMYKDLNHAIRERMTYEQVQSANQTSHKAQRRREETGGPGNSRNRPRKRRSSDTTADG